MRTGPEQFVAKGFAFYDAMVTPALGLNAIAIYEILRRFVWRDENSGTEGQRYGVRNGRLSARVSRKVIAEYTGTSVRTVQRALNRLREVGWLITLDPEPDGGPATFQLGYREKGRGMERFFADDYLRDLWDDLGMLAQEEGLRTVLGLSRAVRLEFSIGWFADPRQPWHTPGATGAHPPRPESPTPSATVALVNKDPSGPKEIENGKRSGRIAKRASPGASRAGSFRGAGSSGHAEEESPSGRRRKEKDPSRMAKPKTFDEVELGDEDDEDEVVKTLTRPTKERLESLPPHIVKAVDRVKEAQTAQLKKEEANEQRAKNLKGTGEHKWPLEVRQHLGDLRRTWNELMEEYDASLTIPRWDAKSVGQVCKLVDMYGGHVTDLALRYVVGHWKTIKQRFKFSGVPTVGVVLSCHTSLVVEAQKWGQHREALAEWKSWNDANPGDFFPPTELKERYRVACEELSDLGFGS